MGDGPRYEDVWRFDALLAAFRKARRAKRGKGDEPAFFLDLEGELLRLSEALCDRTWRPSPYRWFTIHHTKERQVAEATFADRVVHHALVGVLEPIFEARFVPWSYASRRGKGTHAAVQRAQKLARRHRYFLRMDVQRYFDSIAHDVVLGLTASAVPDEGILWLCGQILAVATPSWLPAGCGHGVPIGNLTSQFWANVVLDPVDQHVTRRRGVEAYLRYMDDILVFAGDKRALWELAAEIEGLFTSLGLRAKRRATVVAPVSEGVPWLGFCVWPRLVRLQPEGRRRLARKLAASVAQASQSLQAEDAEVGRAASLCDHTRQANALALRRSLLDRLDAGGPPG